MKHNFIIDEKLSIHPVEGFDNFTQNSVGTKYFAAILDGWAPAQGEHFFVAFERKDGMNKLDPIFMAFKDGVHYTIMPKEVMLDNGEWKANIYKKLNFNEETGKADAQEVGEDFEFLVKRTIRDDSGDAVTQYDIVNLYSSAKDAAQRAEDAAGSAEEKAAISTDAATRAETAAQAAEKSEKNAAASANAAVASAQGAEESASAAKASEESSHDSASAAEQSASEALSSAENAESSATSAREFASEVKDEIKGYVEELAEQAVTSSEEAHNALKAAEEARDKAKDYANLAEAASSSGLRKVIVHTLPEDGSDNYIYLVPSGAVADENFYDEYLWIADEETGKAKWEKIGTTRTDLSAYTPKTLLEDTKEEILLEVSTAVDDLEEQLETRISIEGGTIEGNLEVAGTRGKGNVNVGGKLTVEQQIYSRGPILYEEYVEEETDEESDEPSFVVHDVGQEIANKADKDGTYPEMTVGKATADGNGNDIVDTYATKEELTDYVGRQIESAITTALNTPV